MNGLSKGTVHMCKTGRHFRIKIKRPLEHLRVILTKTVHFWINVHSKGPSIPFVAQSLKVTGIFRFYYDYHKVRYSPLHFDANRLSSFLAWSCFCFEYNHRCDVGIKKWITKYGKQKKTIFQKVYNSSMSWIVKSLKK